LEPLVAEIVEPVLSGDRIAIMPDASIGDCCMDPVTIVIVPGFIGGLLVALVFARLNSRSDASDPFTAERPSTDIINMARIRVAGIGGLGLVAMAGVVAFSIPRIRQSMAIALGLGALLGAVLVLWRRQAGPMPSSGQRPGANITLSIDSSVASERRETSHVQGAGGQPDQAGRKSVETKERRR
jgi:hypothetical protein